MILNKKQQVALDLVLSGENNKIFVTGKAGVGKTAVATEICKKLLQNDNKLIINVVTPSHKSKNIFKEMLREREQKLSSIIRIQTIHKYLGYTIDEDTEQDSELVIIDEKDKLVRASGANDSDILIIEEASMVPDKLFQEAAETSKIVIALGDLNQLKVVSGEDPILENFKIIELTEQMRQEKTDTCLYKAINHFCNNVSNLNNFKFDFENNIDYTLEPAETTLIDAYINKEIDVILCYTNATVDAYNAAIQERLCGYTTPQAGDTLILQRPMFDIIDEDEDFLGNSKDKKIVIVKQNGSRIKVDAIRKDEYGIYEIQVSFMGYRVNIFNKKTLERVTVWKKLIPSEYQKANGLWKLFNKYYRGHILVEDKYGKGKHLYSNRWATFKADIIFAKLPYAMTVHKAQGSSVNNVGVNILDINIAKYRDMDTYNRLMYVALSRAKRSVKYII